MEAFFANWRLYVDKRKEMEIFDKEKRNITSVAEYYALLEKFPLSFQDHVKSMGGIEKYEEDKKHTLTHGYHIYLSKEENAIVLTPRTDYPGIRLDKDK